MKVCLSGYAARRTTHQEHGDDRGCELAQVTLGLCAGIGWTKESQVRCSGCGKDIPFMGTVCPHCHRDKGDDKKMHLLTVFILIACVVAGALINGVAGFFWGVGIAVGACFALGVWSGLRKKSDPPQVRVMQDTSAFSQSHGESPKSQRERLIRLEELRNEGLITAEEYAEQRKRILDEL